ncbi:efflux RND transporter periplasmic adaptor subunit [Pseudidiomarina sediminum]|uniref:Efflux RND transporter periplasmic adaptor subunit n=2 Tax=Pseudidiomarina sediminum TaxID=431675 RepID=A0A432Z3U6_9GAMM|nr:efflux RND transporter periplasmic adaptor subunit [Pseudidiomarina sediminum]RUO72550.1 efflux RND transporter periplasmic adaptor subunit [Pseudidiomarina sediminum]
MKTYLITLTALAGLLCTFPVAALDANHAHDETTTQVELTAAQRERATITTAVLTPQTITYEVYAPGEVVANDFASYQVSPRVDSIVAQRHVSLGDNVQKGQPLVSLYSATMAQAQAAFLVANDEWQRVQALGKATVGEKRYNQALGDYKANKATLLAYGMAMGDLQQLNADSVLGNYQLYAGISGVVMRDNFQQGQHLAAGSALLEISQEETLWVHARLPGASELPVPYGAVAAIQVEQQRYPASVIQQGHTIDPVTRTRTVRLAVENRDDGLHPGLFADVYFQVTSATPVLAVKQAALMRDTAGQWVVFTTTDEQHFTPQVVKLVRELGEWSVIEGLPAGTRYVDQGAFFVSSQLAKGGFDPHNH